MFDKLRDWIDFFEVDQDPHIFDSWLFTELAGAIVKETPGGKRRCDHTRDGSLDGVICMGIATYIVQETPDVVVCNYNEDKKSRRGIMQRVRQEAEQPQQRPRIPMGAGIAHVGGRV